MKQREFIHRKTNGRYRVVTAHNVIAADDIKENDTVVVYEAEDGRMFVRTFKGFFDGRFEEVK